MKIKNAINKHQHLQKKLSEEEIARYWTLSDKDKVELAQYRKDYRLFIAIQLCAVRLYGRFLINCNELSSQLTNYLRVMWKNRQKCLISI